VAYTGDFITGDGEDAFEHLDRVIRHAALGRAGTFAVLGNHDYGHAWRHPDIADRVTARLEAAGIRVLRNAVAPCQGLHFAGFDDLWGRQIEVAHTTAQLPANAPAIALCHNPDAADLPGWDPFDGWILAGHTHGGQIRPPFLPPPHVPVANRRYTAGPFSLSGGRHLFISRGIGHLRHVRFNVRPELARFTLVRA
jgi:predicted MPP superfamily phosphohydrolase